MLATATRSVGRGQDGTGQGMGERTYCHSSREVDGELPKLASAAVRLEDLPGRRRREGEKKGQDWLGLRGGRRREQYRRRCCPRAAGFESYGDVAMALGKIARYGAMLTGGRGRPPASMQYSLVWAGTWGGPNLLPKPFYHLIEATFLFFFSSRE